jgi:hypothetical protein
MGRPKPRSRVLPSPFMPTLSASSVAFSGKYQKMRYFGLSDVAGTLLFAGWAGLLCGPALAATRASEKITSSAGDYAVPRRCSPFERSREAGSKSEPSRRLRKLPILHIRRFAEIINAPSSPRKAFFIVNLKFD